MELLQKYIKEIEQDLKIDEFNVKEVQMNAPGKKHFWISRLINHKVELNNLKNEKNAIRKTLIERVSENSPVTLSFAAIEKTVDKTDEIERLNFKIKENEILIEFLEKTEKVFSSLTFDIRNIVEIIKVENN